MRIIARSTPSSRTAPSSATRTMNTTAGFGAPGIRLAASSASSSSKRGASSASRSMSTLSSRFSVSIRAETEKLSRPDEKP